jgi:hypothetical protein
MQRKCCSSRRAMREGLQDRRSNWPLPIGAPMLAAGRSLTPSGRRPMPGASAPSPRDCPPPTRRHTSRPRGFRRAGRPDQPRSGPDRSQQPDPADRDEVLPGCRESHIPPASSLSAPSDDGRAFRPWSRIEPPRQSRPVPAPFGDVGTATAWKDTFNMQRRHQGVTSPLLARQDGAAPTGRQPCGAPPRGPWRTCPIVLDLPCRGAPFRAENRCAATR